MTFNNAVNSSNADFQHISGILEFALRTRKIQIPGSENLGITYSAGVFTIQAADGSALSSTNRAFVTIPSASSLGTMKTIAITANQSFQDQASGASTINSNLWGTTTSIAWAQDIPFYIYAVLDSAASETNVAFAISRIPHLTISPAAGKLAKSGSAVASTQGSMYLMPNITVSNYAASGLICLGSFRMQKNSSDQWTVQALSSTDGIGRFNDGLKIFTYPVSQNGSATGAHFTANGGTAPVWSGETAFYDMQRNGVVNYSFASNGTGFSTSGVGAVTLTPTIPLTYGVNSVRYSNGSFANSAGTHTNSALPNNPATAVNTILKFQLFSSVADGTTLLNQDCASSAQLSFTFDYIADTA